MPETRELSNVRCPEGHIFDTTVAVPDVPHPEPGTEHQAQRVEVEVTCPRCPKGKKFKVMIKVPPHLP